MKKKQAWMREGARVMANGNPGEITSLQQNRIDSTDYVYYIFVQLDGHKHSDPYHPADVNELLEIAYSVELAFSIKVTATDRKEAANKARAEIAQLPFDIYIDDISEEVVSCNRLTEFKAEVQNV